MCLSGAAPLRPEERPNFVLFYADDLDADEIGCLAGSPNYPHYTGAARLGFPGKGGYEDPRMLTPRIDSLAREGVEFTRFYVTSPVCTPSRYSILTGRYASRSPGLLPKFPAGTPATITWNTPIVPEEDNLAKELQRLGYATGVVGKWHNFPGSEKLPEVDKAFRENDDPRDPKIARQLAEKQERACRALMERYGWTFASRINFGNTELTLPTAIRGQNLEWHTEGALEFLRRYHSKPFFLYYALPVPHGQYFPLRRLNPLATAAGMLDKPAGGQPSRASVYARLKAAGIHERNAMATWMDDAVGAILDALDGYRVADNTIVMFISDNPTRGKYSCYEGARVPALMRWPRRVRGGTKVDSLCANIDILPTLLEAAGGKPSPSAKTDGRSFLNQLTDGIEPPDWRKDLLLEVHNSRAVVTRRWKYIANRLDPNTTLRIQKDRSLFWNGTNHHSYNAEHDFPAYFDADQLYDLETDLYEQKNLAAAPAHTKTRREMQERLSRLLAPLPHAFGEFKKA